MEHNVTELNAPATSNNNNNTSSSVIVQGNPEEGIALGNLSDQQQQQQQQQEHQSQQQLKENLSQQQIQQEPHQLIRQIPLVQQLQQHQQQQQQQQQQHFLSHQQQQPEQQHLHQHQQINPQSQSLLQQQQRHQQIYQKLLTQGSTTTTSTSPSPVSSPPGKTIGRNYNGTMITTSSPSNDAELQLYRVLQRASLLIYYDTLLEMGGDDVQQLCDAGEDEFLEIMALVGMASKPLHVRRLQKVLHEWVNNPSAFQTPLTIPDLSCTGFSPEPCTSRSPFSTAQSYSPSSISGVAASSSGSSNTSTSFGAITTLNTPNQAPNIGSTTSQLQVTASLTEVQIDRLTAGAERLSRELVHMEPRPQSSKKRSTKDLEQVMAMNECNPRRMEEIRKYAAIYGRFDCKRRPEKPLTLHELCVNEAAAQLCKYVPALLTRRDELFPYARQIVRDSGFGHSANISRYPINQQTNTSIESESGNSQTKRLRLSSDTSSEYKDTAEGLRHNLITIYQKLGKAFELPENRRLMNYSRSDYDDNDSRYSFSNSNSPNLQSSNGGVETDSTTTTNDRHFNDTTENLSINNNNNSRISSPEPMDDVKIISSSGSQIIAISNPALALSSSLSSNLQIKNERLSPDII